MGEKKRRLSVGGGLQSARHTPTRPGAGSQTEGGPPTLLVRPAFEADLEQITVIYHHHVMTGTGTFDIDPPSEAAIQERWSKIAAQGWPFLVACAPQQFSRVLGYAYGQPFRERKAYAQTFEDSVYVAPFAQGRGVGRVLLASLLDDLKAQDVQQVIGVIGDGHNHASIALHRALGFWEAGRLHAVGHKFGRWLDVVLMQRQLDQAPHSQT
jgi:phosphinothricin acetyltransferase